MNGYEALAKQLVVLAERAEDTVAGGHPPKAAVQEMAAECRRLAKLAALAGDGTIGGDELARVLSGERDELGRLALPFLPVSRLAREPIFPGGEPVLTPEPESPSPSPSMQYLLQVLRRGQSSPR